MDPVPEHRHDVEDGTTLSADLRVIEARRFGRYSLLTLAGPEMAARCGPGRFVMVRVPGPGFHLRRPLSLHSRTQGAIRVLIDPRGEGSAALAAAETGDTLNVSGPLGTGFPVEGVDRALLVGGGIGVAPFQFLADELRARGVPVAAAFGFVDAVQARLVGAFEIDDLSVATEDGSVGRRGTAVELAEEMGIGPQATVFACGPMPMLDAIGAWTARTGHGGYASLEAHMACGTGACQGCVIRTTTGYRRVCVDGPVFPLLSLRAPA